MILRPTRRSIIKGSAVLLAAPAIIHPCHAWWQSVTQQAIASAPSGSGWGASGTKISLSTTDITNDTATRDGSPNNFTSVRGTQGHTTGKWSFRVKLVVANGGDILMGIADAATATGAAMDTFLGNFVHSGGMYSGSGGGFATVGDFAFPGSGASWSPANNDIYQEDCDLTSGKIYTSVNGTYLNSGDPVGGTGNVGTVANNHIVYPGFTLRSGGDIAQLITTGFSPPSGYSLWG